MKLVPVLLWKHGLTNVMGVLNPANVACVYEDPTYEKGDVCWVVLTGGECLKVADKYLNLCRKLEEGMQ
jgi:hypothetical protein